MNMVLLFYGDGLLILFGALTVLLIICTFGVSFLADWFEKRHTTELEKRLHGEAEDKSVD